RAGRYMNACHGEGTVKYAREDCWASTASRVVRSVAPRRYYYAGLSYLLTCGGVDMAGTRRRFLKTTFLAGAGTLLPISGNFLFSQSLKPLSDVIVLIP